MILTINNLSKTYGATKALQDVSLTLPQGEIIGLFGENGAGKTTLMKCMLNFLAYEGQVLLDGVPISHKNVAHLSFATCEHSYFANLDADAHRDFYQSHFPTFRAKRYAALMEFFQLPKGKPIGQLSTGQKNQFEVILALCQGAEFILMDEPFAGNDIFNREDFYKVLLGILEPTETVLLSTHLLEEVQNFISRALLLRHGELVGDVQMLDLEEQGQTLMGYIKETYQYKADRVAKALEVLT